VFEFKIYLKVKIQI